MKCLRYPHLECYEMGECNRCYVGDGGNRPSPKAQKRENEEEKKMKFDSLQSAIAYALEGAYNNGNIYEVVDDDGNVYYTANPMSIANANTSEELENMNWWLYAEEVMETTNLEDQEGVFLVKFVKYAGR